MLKYLRNTADCHVAERKIRNWKTPEPELRVYQGVLNTMDLIFELTPHFVRGLRDEYLQNLKERVRFEQETEQIT